MMLIYQGSAGVRSSDFKIGMAFKNDMGDDVSVIVSLEALEDKFEARGDHLETAKSNVNAITQAACAKYKNGDKSVLLSTKDFS